MPSATSGSSARPPWIKRAMYGFVVIPGLLGAVLLAGAGVYFFQSVPFPDDITVGATVVLDRNGEEVGTLSAQAARQDIALSQLPEHVPQAVLAAEDRGFYDHGGISWRGTARALFRNIQARDIEEGGSTITQQYIKNAALTADRTFTRKANEAVLALKLERQQSKDNILEMYLNTIYWGRGAYGIEAAAQTYFDVPATELTINQAATLGGIIRSPSRLDPAEDPASADIRRRYTLDGMVGEGWLDQATAEQAVNEGLPSVSDRQTVEFGPAAYYLDAVRRVLSREIGEDIIFRGLTVHTELDMSMQTTAQQVITEHLANVPEGTAESPVSAALVTVDPEDGGVRAIVGGPDFAKQQFNAAVRGGRQPGSAFKPFGLAAFTDAGYSPESRFKAPAKIEIDFPGHGTYEVGNYGGSDFGEQTVQQATWSSTNTVFMQMVEVAGVDRVRDLAVDAGIPDTDAVPEVPSLVLGTADVTPYHMANAFATFASGGVRNEPRLVSRVVDGKGDVIYENGPESTGAMDSNVAYVVSSALQGVIQSGTGQRAQIGRPAAGKTGTTNDHRDAWFVGYVPQLSTAVWVGTMDNLPMEGMTGGSLPAEIWAAYMTQAVEGMEVRDFPAPDLSGLEILNEAPEPEPSPSPETTECPDEDGELIETILEEGEECPEHEPEPSPSPTPTEEESPLPLPGDDDEEEEPDPSPTPTDDGDGDDGDTSDEDT
jgi:penicillin-binding protein 1A